MAELKNMRELDPPHYSVPAPVDKQEEKGNSRLCLWLLIFYTGAVTAAIITISVLGAKYINDMESYIRPPTADQLSNEYKHHHLGHDHVNCSLDTEADKQIFRFFGEEYGENTMAVLDFKKGVAGIHNGLNNTCYLIGGLDPQLPNSTVLEKFLSEQGTSEQERTYVYYVVIEERPVKNLALLPAELYEPCWGKPVYWLEKINQLHGDRKKRHTIVEGCIEVCYGWSAWGACLGWRVEGCVTVEHDHSESSESSEEAECLKGVTC